MYVPAGGAGVPTGDPASRKTLSSNRGAATSTPSTHSPGAMQVSEAWFHRLICSGVVTPSTCTCATGRSPFTAPVNTSTSATCTSVTPVLPVSNCALGRTTTASVSGAHRHIDCTTDTCQSPASTG
ncbi:hypothetical protein D3C87_1638190 [compost metagenome]